MIAIAMHHAKQLKVHIPRIEHACYDDKLVSIGIEHISPL